MWISVSVSIGMCLEIIFGQDGRVLMLDESTLKVNEVFGPRIGISSKTSIDALHNLSTAYVGY